MWNLEGAETEGCFPFYSCEFFEEQRLNECSKCINATLRIPGGNTDELFCEEDCPSHSAEPVGIQLCRCFKCDNLVIPDFLHFEVGEQHAELGETDVRLMSEEGGIGRHGESIGLGLG